MADEIRVPQFERPDEFDAAASSLRQSSFIKEIALHKVDAETSLLSGTTPVVSVSDNGIERLPADRTLSGSADVLTIFVCIYGTWQERSSRKEKPLMSTIYNAYDDRAYILNGAGTGGNFLYKYFGAVMGLGIDEEIEQAYNHIAENYNFKKRTRVFLSGYSRGAHAVRAVLDMISKIGIPKRKSMDTNRNLFLLYKQGTLSRAQSCENVMEVYGCEHIQILAVFLYDTVSSLGVPQLNGAYHKRKHHETDVVPNNVGHVYQAFALDEKRPPYALSPICRSNGSTNHIVSVAFKGTHHEMGWQHKNGGGLSIIVQAWMLDMMLNHGLQFKDGAIAKLFPGFGDPKRASVRPAWHWLSDSVRHRMRFMPQKRRNLASMTPNGFFSNIRIHESVHLREQHGSPPGVCQIKGFTYAAADDATSPPEWVSDQDSTIRFREEVMSQFQIDALAPSDMQDVRGQRDPRHVISQD